MLLRQGPQHQNYILRPTIIYQKLTATTHHAMVFCGGPHSVLTSKPEKASAAAGGASRGVVSFMLLVTVMPVDFFLRHVESLSATRERKGVVNTGYGHRPSFPPHTPSQHSYLHCGPVPTATLIEWAEQDASGRPRHPHHSTASCCRRTWPGLCFLQSVWSGFQLCLRGKTPTASLVDRAPR